MYSYIEIWVAAAAGILSHPLIFIHGEWHLQATGLLKSAAFAFAITALFEARLRSLSWLSALSVSATLCGVFAFCLFGSITIYRTLFHRLGGFQGPFLARISKLWHVAQCLDSKNYVLLEKLRQQYGDFVRTGV